MGTSPSSYIQVPPPPRRKQAGQLLMKTSNFDKQAGKFLITSAKKLKNISVIDITGHDVSYQLLRMNHIPFYFENKSQTNCTRNTVKYSTVQHCISVKLCQMLLCSLLFSKCICKLFHNKI